MKQNNKKNTSASGILDQLIFDGNEEKLHLVAEESANAEVASLIFDARTSRGLTQQELAERVGTTKSVISRLEDSDYRGHSLAMLRRIASALNMTVRIALEEAPPAPARKRAVRSAAPVAKPPLSQQRRTSKKMT